MQPQASAAIVCISTSAALTWQTLWVMLHFPSIDAQMSACDFFNVQVCGRGKRQLVVLARTNRRLFEEVAAAIEHSDVKRISFLGGIEDACGGLEVTARDLQVPSTITHLLHFMKWRRALAHSGPTTIAENSGLV